MKVLLSLLLCLLPLQAALCAQAQDPVEVVQLESIRVNPNWFLVDYSLDEQGKITVVTLVEITPGSPVSKASVRKGDTLEAINGLPVRGMLPRDFDGLLYHHLAKGECKLFRFSLSRGFFKRRTTLLDLKVVQR